MSQGKRMEKGGEEYLLINISSHLAGMHTGQAEFSISTDYNKGSVCYVENHVT